MNEKENLKAQNGNREYRSDVFSMLMEDPARALDVYNALNGSDYDERAPVHLFAEHAAAMSALFCGSDQGYAEKERPVQLPPHPDPDTAFCGVL